MPVDAGSIYSDVRIRLDKLSADIGAVNTKFDQMAAKVDSSTKKTTASTTKSFNAFAVAGTAAIGLVTLAFKKAVTVFAETEQSLANVKAVSGATAAEFKLIEQAAADAGSTTRFTAKEAADALFFLSSAGLSATQSVSALDGVLELAGATGSDLSQSAQTLTATLSQFNLEASKAADVSNVFAAANANSQATLSRLQGALRQVGSVAGALNIGLEEVVGSLQVLYNAGFEGEAAGRALKSALADLANESSVTNKKLSALGISFDSVNPEVVGLTGAIGTLEKAGLSTAQVIDLFGKVAGPQLVTLINTGEEALIEYEQAVTGTNEATKQYAIQNDTLAGSFDSLSSAIEGTGNTYVKKLNPYIREVVDLTTDLTRALGIAGEAQDTNSNKALKWGLSLLNPITTIQKITTETTKWVLNLSRQNREADKAAEAIKDYEGSLDGLSAATGVSEQAVDSLFEAINKDLYTAVTANDDISVAVSQISQQYGISVEQINEIAQKSTFLSESSKTQLSTLRDQIVEMKTQNQYLDSWLAKDNERAAVQARTTAELERQAQVEDDLLAEKERKESAIAEIEMTLASIRELEVKGLISTEESLSKQIDYRESLLGKYKDQSIAEGELSDEVADNIRSQNSLLEQLYARRDELAESSSNKEAELLAFDYENYSQWSANKQGVITEFYRARQDQGKTDDEIEAELLQKKKDRQIEYFQSISGLANDFFGALAGLYQANADARIEELDRELQAELESKGIAEETTIESLNKQLDEAITAGNTEKANELRNSIEREKIIKDYEKKKAKIQYESQLNVWGLSNLQAAISAAQAQLSIWANPLTPVPIKIIESSLAGAVSAVNIAAIQAAKPTPPSFATGGIVMPGSSGTVVNVAENGSSEVLFNTGSEGQAFIDQMGAAIAMALGGGRPINLNIDGERLASYLADTFYSTADVTIDGRGIR